MPKALVLATTLTASLALIALPAQADAPAPSTTIDIAGHQVPVPTGGLYDRFRSNPPLSVIAAEAPGLDLSWFRTLHKEPVNIGFTSYSPNFYYDNGRVSVIYTADLDTLKSLMPAEVLKVAPPLQIWPGRGLVVLTAYTYRHCDNDTYNEIGLSVVTARPDGGNWGPLTLLGHAMSNDFWGYVLKLPVSTELARVRGVVGYNLPKWLTDISYRETDQSVVVDIVDAATGQVDVTLETRKLPDVTTEPTLVTNHFTNVDQHSRLTTGYAVSRQLQHASSTDADAVTLHLSNGGRSTYIKALKLGKMMRYEYVPSFQSALYAPEAM